MERPLLAPWETRWWPELCRCAERGGSDGSAIIEKVLKGHSIGWPTDGGYLVLDRTEDNRICVWLGVGCRVSDWWKQAEKEVSEFARSVGCVALRIEGRSGWRRILPHWTRLANDDLELPV